MLGEVFDAFDGLEAEAAKKRQLRIAQGGHLYNCRALAPATAARYAAQLGNAYYEIRAAGARIGEGSVGSPHQINHLGDYALAMRLWADVLLLMLAATLPSVPSLYGRVDIKAVARDLAKWHALPDKGPDGKPINERGKVAALLRGTSTTWVMRWCDTRGVAAA